MDFIALLKAERAKSRSCGGVEAPAKDAQRMVQTHAKIEEEEQPEDELCVDLKALDSLSNCPLHSIPASCLLYLSEAVSENDADMLLRRINTKQWTSLRQRRLQHWGKKPNAEIVEENEPLPNWLDHIANQLVAAGIFPSSHKPNNVLINEYIPPLGGILHHTDGPCYFPCVAVLSLGGPVVLTFKPRLRPEDVGVLLAKPLCSVLLEPNSLLVFKETLYADYLHGIEVEKEADVLGEEEEEQVCVNSHVLREEFKSAASIVGAKIEREMRTSLTFRFVL